MVASIPPSIPAAGDGGKQDGPATGPSRMGRPVIISRSMGRLMIKASRMRILVIAARVKWGG